MGVAEGEAVAGGEDAGDEDCLKQRHRKDKTAASLGLFVTGYSLRLASLRLAYGYPLRHKRNK